MKTMVPAAPDERAQPKPPTARMVLVRPSLPRSTDRTGRRRAPWIETAPACWVSPVRSSFPAKCPAHRPERSSLGAALELLMPDR